jgi:hypothetical protein
VLEASVCATCRHGHALTPANVVNWGRRGPQCRTCQNQASLLYHRRLREEAIAHYGGACGCCGETELAFLAIDHLNGGGRAHRQAIGWGGSNLYGWLHRMGYPPGFGCLCHNCNVARGLYGACPHGRRSSPAGVPNSQDRSRRLRELAQEIVVLLDVAPISDLPPATRGELRRLYQKLNLMAGR